MGWRQSNRKKRRGSKKYAAFLMKCGFFLLSFIYKIAARKIHPDLNKLIFLCFFFGQGLDNQTIDCIIKPNVCLVVFIVEVELCPGNL